MIQINGVDIPSDVAVEVYFTDHRIIRILTSIQHVNSSVALPSLVLLLPILASLLSPDEKDLMVLLCLGILPATVLCQSLAVVASLAKKRRSLKLLTATLRLAIACIVLGSLGSIPLIALIVFSSKSCTRITCVADAICASILCLITILSIVYNTVHGRVLHKAIYHNEVLRERTVAIDLTATADASANQVQGIFDDAVDDRQPHLEAESQLGFSYLRFENPREVFP